MTKQGLVKLNFRCSLTHCAIFRTATNVVLGGRPGTVLVTPPPGLDKHLERTRRLFFHQTSSVLSQVTTEPSCSKQNYDADRVESTFQSFPCGWCLFLRSRQAAIQNFPAPFFSKKKEKEKVYMFFVLHGSLNPTSPAVRQIKSVIILPINLEWNCGCGAVKHEPVSTKKAKHLNLQTTKCQARHLCLNRLCQTKSPPERC